MPKRMNVKEIKSTEIQGEDSWVKIKRPTVADIKRLIKEGRVNQKLLKEMDAGEIEKIEKDGIELEPEDVVFDVTMDVLSDHVFDWNWVDDEGNPLPKPFKNTEVFENLTDEELSWISSQILGSEKTRKN